MNRHEPHFVIALTVALVGGAGRGGEEDSRGAAGEHQLHLLQVDASTACCHKLISWPQPIPNHLGLQNMLLHTEHVDASSAP